MIGCSKLCLKRIEKIIRENAFEQKTKNPRLKFNPGLAVIGLRTTGPWTVNSNFKSIRWTLPNVSFEIFSKLIAKKKKKRDTKYLFNLHGSLN